MIIHFVDTSRVCNILTNSLRLPAAGIAYLTSPTQMEGSQIGVERGAYLVI